MQAPPKEVLYAALQLVAREVAFNASLYYEALVRKAHGRKGEVSCLRRDLGVGCRPDYALQKVTPADDLIRKMKVLYGARQMDL